MNKEELKRTLSDAGFGEWFYDLEDQGKDDAIHLTIDEGKWCTFYQERGAAWDRRCYSSEAEACEDVLHRLEREPAARVRPDIRLHSDRP